MGAVQVDLLLVSQLSHGGMLGTPLAFAALCSGVWAGFVFPAQVSSPVSSNVFSDCASYQLTWETPWPFPSLSAEGSN